MYKKLILLYFIVVVFMSTAIYASEATTEQNYEIISLSLVPAAEPVPALSYRLLPHFSEQKTGNAALFYNSAAGLYPSGNNQDVTEKIQEWLDLPIEQLDRKEVEEALGLFKNCFRQIKLATERNYCQWEMPIEEGYSMQMPHLASFRNMIRAMKLQIRLDIADGKNDSALELIQDGMYMGKCISEGPTIIQGLVGIAINGLMLDELENLIQRPDSPNFYWALTSLPDPLIDLQRAIKTEREVMFFEFPKLRDIENQVLSPAQATEIVSEFIVKIQSLGQDIDDNMPFKEILPAGWVMMHYSDAKKFLEDKGYSKERIEQMPTAQVVLIYQKLQYVEVADNIYKWFELPYSQAKPYLVEAEKIADEQYSNDDLKSNLLFMMLPAMSRISFIQVRLERDIDMLRIVEAIRMFAANNSGEVPESLSDVTIVPIPQDPVSGKDFIYRKIDKTHARLEAPFVSERNYKIPVYELSIK